MHATEKCYTCHQLMVEERQLDQYTTMPPTTEVSLHGICKSKFRLRYANHKKSFDHRNRKLNTELFNNFWKIKYTKRSANITWEILG